MNIRKIIKEELDGFEWVDSVGDSDYLIGRQFVINRRSNAEAPSGIHYLDDVYTIDSIENNIVTVSWDVTPGFAPHGRDETDYTLDAVRSLIDDGSWILI